MTAYPFSGFIPVPPIDVEKEVSVHTIIKCVCDDFNVQISDLYGKSRFTPIPEAKQVIIYLIRKLIPELSMPYIAKKIFNYKDHTTVCHSVRTVQGYIDTSEEYRNRIDMIIQSL